MSIITYKNNKGYPIEKLTKDNRKKCRQSEKMD